MLKKFNIIAFLEGVSYLVILYNMLVNKPLYPELYQMLLKPVGMAHGVLFIAYVALAFLLKKPENWSYKDLFIILLASLIPFATFWVEYKYCKKA